MHDHHDSHTTIVTEGMDREGPATALIVLLILAFVGFLIWLFAFSGVGFHRGGGSTTVNNNNTRIEQPANPSTNPGGGETQPQPTGT